MALLENLVARTAVSPYEWNSNSMWIIRENLKKNRLMKMDSKWVAEMENRP